MVPNWNSLYVIGKMSSFIFNTLTHISVNGAVFVKEVLDTSVCKAGDPLRSFRSILRPYVYICKTYKASYLFRKVRMGSKHFVISWMFDFNSFAFRLAMTELRRGTPHWKCNNAIAKQTKASVCGRSGVPVLVQSINQWINESNKTNHANIYIHSEWYLYK